MQVLGPVAEAGSNWWIDTPRVLVAANYRLAKYKETVDSLNRLSEVMHPPAECVYLAAMAYHRLGQTEKAQQMLRLAIAATTKTAAHPTTRAPVIGYDSRFWGEQVADRLLRQEAEALILAADDRDAVLPKPSE
jgi:hypothetical protein